MPGRQAAPGHGQETVYDEEPHGGTRRAGSRPEPGILSLPKYAPSRVGASDTLVRSAESMELVLAALGDRPDKDDDSRHIALASEDRSAAGSAGSGVTEDSADETSGGGAPDVDALAREVYMIIKRRLAVERERAACR